MLTYEDYKLDYPDTKLDETKFNEYYTIIYNRIERASVYDLTKLNETKQNQIVFYIKHQIRYFEKEGLEKKGIVSQTNLSTSVSVNSDAKKGDINYSQIFDEWLKNSGLQIRAL